MLGKNVFFSPNVKLVSSNHDYSSTRTPIKEYPIRNGDNVWIGTSVIILSEVENGKNYIIRAGSVDTKSLPSNINAFGNSETIKGHLCSCGSRYNRVRDNFYLCQTCNSTFEIEL